MCGIAGIAHIADAPELEAQLEAMAASMQHRGPDDQGIEIVRGRSVAGLCACRLAIQDLSPNGHQPMRSARTGNVVALNGEIYNVVELRDELQGLGHAFTGHSDTEVLLRGFDEWGEGCFARLRGMFGVAVWDAAGDRLVLARDRLGIKPLFHALREGRLVFASELRTVLRSGLVEPRVSPDGLASFLSLGAVREPLTMIDGVACLQPGHIGSWRDGAWETREYWSLREAFEGGTPTSREDAVAALRHELEQATRQHLVSDVPLGVFLSGGIDSSALVGLVDAVAGAPPRTVSVVFPQQKFSEAPFIRQVSERFSTDHTELEMDPDAALEEVPRAVAAMDQPTFDGVNTFIVSRLAREAGLTVVLSGLGGDELFGGYDTFSIVPRLERARRLVPAPVGALAAGAAGRVGTANDRVEKLTRWLARADPDATAYDMRRELFSPAVRNDLLRNGDHGASAALPSSPANALNAVSMLELDVYMRNVLLRDSDVMSMAHSLELRVPFIDHRLVELVAPMPGAWKTPGKKPKPLLVDALSDILPHDVVYRRKMGFVLPFVDWLKGPLRPAMEEVLLDPNAGGQVGELLDPEHVTRVWQRFLDGKGWWVRPWALYVAKAWGEQHLPR